MAIVDGSVTALSKRETAPTYDNHIDICFFNPETEQTFFSKIRSGGTTRGRLVIDVVESNGNFQGKIKL